MCAEKKFFFDARKFRSFRHDAVVHFFEEARYCGENGRLNLAQVITDRIEAFRIINGYSPEQIEISNHAFENMIERKKAERFHIVEIGKAGDAGHHIAQNVMMRKHYALWCSCCA